MDIMVAETARTVGERFCRSRSQNIASTSHLLETKFALTAIMRISLVEVQMQARNLIFRLGCDINFSCNLEKYGHFHVHSHGTYTCQDSETTRARGQPNALLQFIVSPNDHRILS